MNYRTRHLVLSGIFIALGILLPFILHSIPNGGKIFLPMHLPVLALSFFVSWPWALAVGALTPLLSSLLTGMPPMTPFPMAIIMSFELATYGLIISLLRKKAVKRERWYSPLLALAPALVLGRVVAGIVLWGAVSAFGVKGPAPWVFVSGGIITGLPGIIVQIILVPLLYHVLVRNLPGWREALR